MCHGVTTVVGLHSIIAIFFSGWSSIHRVSNIAINIGETTNGGMTINHIAMKLDHMAPAETDRNVLILWQSCNERKQQKCLFNKAKKGMKSFQNPKRKFVDDCDFSVWLFPVVAMSKMSDLVRGKVLKRFRTVIHEMINPAHPDSSIFWSSLVLTKQFFSLHPKEFVGEILIFQAC